MKTDATMPRIVLAWMMIVALSLIVTIACAVLYGPTLVWHTLGLGTLFIEETDPKTMSNSVSMTPSERDFKRVAVYLQISRDTHDTLVFGVPYSGSAEKQFTNLCNEVTADNFVLVSKARWSEEGGFIGSVENMWPRLDIPTDHQLRQIGARFNEPVHATWFEKSGAGGMGGVLVAMNSYGHVVKYSWYRQCYKERQMRIGKGDKVSSQMVPPDLAENL